MAQSIRPQLGRIFNMSNHVWWNLTRASANIATVLILFTILWGVLLTTRILKPNDRPAWLRDLHTWMGGLALTFTVIHMLTLIADSYIAFDIVDVLVPFASSWKPIPVTLGILAFYILLAVQMTSLFVKKLDRKTWHRIHVLSYLQFIIVIAHALSAGSDVGTRLFTGFTMAVAMMGSAVYGIRVVAGRSVDRRKKERGLADN